MDGRGSKKVDTTFPRKGIRLEAREHLPNQGRHIPPDTREERERLRTENLNRVHRQREGKRSQRQKKNFIAPNLKKKLENRKGNSIKERKSNHLWSLSRCGKGVIFLPHWKGE